ncbi:MAG: cytochrome-c peroxidase [Planctomycetales bacterium]|jgi:cytochrome c peroxidase
MSRIFGTLTILLVVASSVAKAQNQPRLLAVLPSLGKTLDPAQVDLGRQLFFDPRLSGDATISCATCHSPEHGWADGIALSKGYPGTRYFRNTPTVVNAALGRLMYWDGRLPSSDLPTLVRDHISEAHFLQADGRLVIERMRQVPEYERQFKSAFGGEPSYGRILNAVAAFVSSLTSQEVPFDKFLAGDEAAISEEARRGLEIFKGKAGCIQCHDGAMLSDGKFHSLGLNANPEIFQDPLRHITFRRFFRTLGVADYAAMRHDAGLYCVTKVKHDRELIRTPTLREVSKTAPYMHDGQLPTLEAVVSFYNSGGGPRASKDARLKPLGLTDVEQADLVTFLKTLSGKPIEVAKPKLPAYQLRKLGDN